jgi:hypothetical protein
MRQAHRCGAFGGLRLVLGEPAELGDGDGADRHDSHGLRPRPPACLGVAVTELADEVRRAAPGPGVVPQQRGAYHLAVVVQADHAVLLGAHGDGVDVVQAPGTLEGLLEGSVPGARIDLGGVRMTGSTLAYQLAGVSVVHDDLAGLRR